MGKARDAITGCILAGGQGKRFAGVDKGLVKLAGRPLLIHVFERFRPQVDNVILSANRNHQFYQAYCENIVADELDGYAGPLAGFAAAMNAAATPLLAVTPCDSPFIPTDMVAKLQKALSTNDADIGVVRTGKRLQPVFALMRCHLKSSLTTYLNSGQRKIDAWYARHRVAEVDFGETIDTFNNINTPEDLATAENRLKKHD